MKRLHTIFILFYFVDTYTAEQCIFIRSGGSDYVEERDCNQTEVCNRQFRFSALKMPPYSDINLVLYIIEKCCGRCLGGKPYYSYFDYNAEMITTKTGIIRKYSDFVFPYLATIDAKTLYGWYFVPLVPVPSFFFITRKEGNILGKLIISSLELYPLVIICLTLAVISGFIIWLLETWFNEKEFPRPFLIGWFEGFWWSFISMTTVGYGDKTPKKVVARIFSVVWILMGVALFGIVTAEITNILVEANNPSPPEVRGKLVGVLKYREYDKSYVTKNGGIVHYTNFTSIDENYMTDIHGLTQSLRNGKLDGIILDRSTMAYTMEYFRNETLQETDEHKANARFMLNDTLRTEKIYSGDKMAYGVIIKEQKHYEFFGSAITDNRLSLISNKELEWNQRDETVKSKENLFNPSGPYFLTSMKVIAGIIGIIIVFGILFEVKRRDVRILSSNDTPKYEMNPPNA